MIDKDTLRALNLRTLAELDANDTDSWFAIAEELRKRNLEYHIALVDLLEFALGCLHPNARETADYPSIVQARKVIENRNKVQRPDGTLRSARA